MRDNLIAAKSLLTGAAIRLTACTLLLALLSSGASAQKATDGSTPSVSVKRAPDLRSAS